MSPTGELHISSAIVSALPEQCEAVARRLAALPETEVHHVVEGKIVIVMEGPSERALGQRLAEIALMEHVLSANMVYEVVDSDGAQGEAPGGAPGGAP